MSACASLPVSAPPGASGLRLAATGTGFFIGRDIVLTNYHVAAGCAAVTVGNNVEGMEIAATFVAGDPAADLAVLSAAAPDVSPAQFRMTIDTDTRQRWAIVGYPEHGLPVSQAELDRVWIDPVDFLGDDPSFTFSGSVRHGNSGSPVLDDHGLVVGIVHAKLDSEKIYQKTGALLDETGIAISNREVFDFLRAHRIAFQRAAATATRSPRQLLNDAHGFVRQIACWK
jgi:S1-C subfamily serine protease